MANLVLTPEWVVGIYQLETSDPVMGGPDGVDNKQAIQLGKRTEWLKKEVEKQAPKNNPAFTGTPTAPTAEQTVNDNQIATTAFVKTAIAALVGSAPAALDTLAEIATALGNDGNVKQVLLTEIGKKANLTDFTNLKNLLVGIPFPYPLSAVPSGCLAFNGQTFSTSLYPELAKKYPSGRLPDLRGEFIRGWDNGRGVDSGRSLLSLQENLLGSHTHDVKLGIIDTSVSGYATHRNRNELGWGQRGTDGLAVKSNGEVTIYATGTNLIYSSGGSETRPRNIAFQYICLAA